MKKDKLYLIHIMESIGSIESYTKGGKDEFMANPMIQDAVIRKFEIMGEAVKRLSENIRTEEPNVPWRSIAGFRDVLIHQYMGVDINQVWNIIENDMPGIKRAVEDA